MSGRFNARLSSGKAAWFWPKITAALTAKQSVRLCTRLNVLWILLLTWWLRTTMAGIEGASSLLPYPWGDRLEVVLRGIGGSFWIQIALAIIIVRIFFWLLGHGWRHARRRSRRQHCPQA